MFNIKRCNIKLRRFLQVADLNSFTTQDAILCELESIILQTVH